jgi:hypothetical protein
MTEIETVVAVVRSRREHRIVAFETIGCALATLRRLDHVWYDEDIRATITSARSSLSVAQSRVKQRIDEPLVERTSV